MSTVIQANCPNCKNSLRIPVDWIQQAIRCKHCGTAIKAKTPAQAAAPRRQVVQARSAPAQPESAPEPAPIPLVPIPAQSIFATPAAPAQQQAAAPVPIPMAVPQNGFSNVQDEAGVYTPTSTIGRRRRRNATVFWIKTGVTLAILLAAGICFYAYLWDPIKERVEKEIDKSERAEKGGKGKNQGTGGSRTSGGTERRGNPGKGSNTGRDNGNRTPNGNQPKDGGNKPPEGSVTFPRRALVVSIHNYLFANPTHFGSFARYGSRNVRATIGRMSRSTSFNIDGRLITHLSDLATEPHSPTKPVVMRTIENYLEASRPQDSAVLVFIGHGVEVDEKPYLVPIDGEVEGDAEEIVKSLIPLEWLMQELDKCKARQKLLILDVCRYNPDRGQERPGGDPMGETFAKTLEKPPEGVQVWTSCGMGERSYEFDFNPVSNGLFIDALYRAAERGVEGKIQRPDDPIPVDELHAMVNKEMRGLLDSLKYKQVSRLYGKMKPSEARFDPKAPMPPKPAIARAPNLEGGEASPRTIQQILAEISVPPIKPTDREGMLTYKAMPPLPANVIDKYPIDNTPSKVRDAIAQAQAMLWAVSPVPPPKELVAAVGQARVRGELENDLSVMKGFYRIPAEANVEAFKAQIMRDQQQLTTIQRLLTDEFDNLEALAGERAKLSPRWQANYDFMIARVHAQIAYVFEHNSMLGQMRKELPAYEMGVHTGWRLSSREKPKGDTIGKRHARKARGILEDLAGERPSTPWALLAKRERLTALGLEWQATKGGY